jgi:hypothetical protein
MAGRLATLRVVDPILSNMAIGYQNAELIGAKLFPFVQVEKAGAKVPVFGKEAFRVENTKRALRAERARVDHNTDSMTVDLEEHSLEGAVDTVESEEAWYDIAEASQRVVQDKLALELEDEVATLALAAANYGGGNKNTALTGNTLWSASHDDSKPVDNIETGAEAIRAKIGRRPNTLVMGPAVWAKLKHHAQLRAILGASDLKVITFEHVLSVFAPWLKTVLVGEGVKLSGAVLGDVWGKHALLAYVPETPGRGVPAFGYTFRKKGRPTTSKYRDERRNSDIIVVEDFYKPYHTLAEAGYLITNAVA